MVETFSSDRYCSLGDNRSWVDLVTNMAVLSGVQLEEDLAYLMDLGATPKKVIATFLHEVTHHWCFNSVVGSTLSYLQLRARRQAATAIMSEHLSSSTQANVLEDLTRYETAAAFLRPLAEGLALFAEFDAVSRGATVRSSPMDSLINFFVSPDRVVENGFESDPVQAIDRTLAELLLAVRLTSNGLDRKEHLLSSPLSYAGGGYLPGYLTVKNLWVNAGSRCQRLLNDSDLFMMFLRSFFYDDLSFVSVLLDPTTEGLESANAIANYISQRFQQFTEIELERTVTNFEQEVKDYTSATSLMSIQTDPSLSDLGEKRLQAVTAEINSTVSKIDTDDAFAVSNALTMLRRAVLYIGSLQALVDIDDNGKIRVSHNGTTLLEGSPSDLVDIEAGEDEGSIDVFWTSRGSNVLGLRAIAISRGEQVVSLVFKGSVEEDAVEQIRDYLKGLVKSRRSIENESGVLREGLDLVVRNSSIESRLRHIQDHLPALVEHVYLPLALFRVPDETFEQCYELMRENGYYSILREDFSLFRALALLTMCCSITPQRSTVAYWFSYYQMDLDSTLSALSSYAEQYGTPEVLGNEALLCIV